MYKLFAPHRKGFGVHSPFVFHLVSRVFTREDDENLKDIKVWRNELSANHHKLTTADLGAGSIVHIGKDRKISRIVRNSSISHKFGRILYALVNEFKPAIIIELGTGIGISTAYLAKACPESHVISVEGDRGKMDFAIKSIELLGLKNVSFRNGSFKDVLPGLIRDSVQPLLVFIDGDHSYKGTMEYFTEIITSVNSETVIIFDDIRWSPDMEKAWNEIRQYQEVKISVDLFFMGIVFFREGVFKQDFVINF